MWSSLSRRLLGNQYRDQQVPVPFFKWLVEHGVKLDDFLGFP